MGLPRSTYYDTPATEADTEIVARITAICEEFEAYGIVKLTACRLFSAFLHEVKPLKSRRAGINNLQRFRSESG